jgi:hypothetical protein
MFYLAQPPYHKLPHTKLSHTTYVIEALGFVLFLAMLMYLLALLIWSFWDQRHPQPSRQERDDLREIGESLSGQANTASASELYLSSTLSGAAFEDPIGSTSPHATEIIADASSAEDQGVASAYQNNQ